MAQEPEVLEDVPPQGHVRVVYLGPVAPHWEVHGIFGDRIVVDEFRQRAMARLQLLPPHDPQFRRNRERVARDAEREHLILDWDLGYDEESHRPVTAPTGPGEPRDQDQCWSWSSPGCRPVTMNITRSAIVTAWSAIRS